MLVVGWIICETQDIVIMDCVLNRLIDKNPEIYQFSLISFAEVLHNFH